MIYRNFIAPSHGFTQFSHELIRHPRLNSDAVRLLTWQLSLPEGARESLSRTAERARIGACAFTRAKRQLKEEGFVHERRMQVAGGRWVTQQLLSNRPLNEAEAAKLLGGMPMSVAAPAHVHAPAPAPAPAPSPRIPAVGEPAPPPTDGHPKKDRDEDTSNPPPEPAPETEPGDEARVLLTALPLLSPALRNIPPGMRDELARLVARWLAAGHTPDDVRRHILRGLPGPRTPLHRPGGLLRYLLREVPPVVARPAPRLAGTRECEGDHVQGMLFRPVADETLCGACSAAERPATAPAGS
ncbi:hypothetical protein ACFY8W_12055 [Streptomyces sp. NPDC012637]|uniref:hypothetical protein n=1 Tax=Streptomyces sp. NPDC012637 TaxID=3364842 RepID=UPI0036E63F0F